MRTPVVRVSQREVHEKRRLIRQQTGEADTRSSTILPQLFLLFSKSVFFNLFSIRGISGMIIHIWGTLTFKTVRKTVILFTTINNKAEWNICYRGTQVEKHCSDVLGIFFQHFTKKFPLLFVRHWIPQKLILSNRKHWTIKTTHYAEIKNVCLLKLNYYNS